MADKNAEYRPAREEWVRVVDGVTYRSWLREAEPGIYHVSTELMEQMMRELGWERSPDGE